MEEKNSKVNANRTGSSKSGANKKLLIFLALIIIVIVVVVVVVVNNRGNSEGGSQVGEQGQTQFYREEEGTKINTSKELSKTKEFEGLEISNVSLTEFEDNSTFTATLTNKTDGVSGDFFLDLKFVDKDNNEIATISCKVDPVDPGQSIELNASATASLANAYDYSIAKQQNNVQTENVDTSEISE